MFARVATFEGLDASRVDEVVADVQRELDSGTPPEGLERVAAVTMLVDREGGKGLAITLFRSEEDLRRGDEALNAMSPAEGGGRRTDVGFYEVVISKEWPS